MTADTMMTRVEPPKRSLIAAMAEKYAMEPKAFADTVKATVMPSGATNEQMAAFLLVAHEYDLNPITKEIYAFPARGGGVQPVVGIDGWINLAQRRPEFDGMEFEFEHDSNGAPSSCTCKLYRKDRQRPVIVTEYMDECKRPTEPWKSHPRRMLRHKALIQAIRYAFGFTGVKDEDDVLYTTHTVEHGSQADAIPYVSGADQLKQIASSSDRRKQQDAQDSMDPPPGVEIPEQTGHNGEWPKPDPVTGELLDAQGCPWLEQVHSGGKTCNENGYWRRRKGVLPSEARDAEKEAMAKRKAQNQPAAPREGEEPPFDMVDQPQQQASMDVGSASSSSMHYQGKLNTLYNNRDGNGIEDVLTEITNDQSITDQERDALTSRAVDMLDALG